MILQDIIPCSPAPIMANGKRGVEVVGVFHTASGIGESARLCALQLAQAGYKVRCVSMENAFPYLRGKPHEADWNFQDTAEADDIGCRIIHLNPVMMVPAIFSMGLLNYRRVYNIGYWAWELEVIPREWQRALGHVNAVFCPSEFTSRTIRLYTEKPVITVSHPVKVDGDTAATGMRQKLGLSDDVFLVSSVFSFGSALERKNPDASIEAFVAAFGGNDKACLVFKSNAGGTSADKQRLMAKIAPHKNIRLIDDVWSREEMLGFMKSSDVYMSLHRSEGFGLPIAEAMLLGTPVVTTNWSGNTDFCNTGNCHLVGVDMIQVESGYPEFRRLGSTQWADPRVTEAAAALKAIYGSADKGRTMAARALLETREFFSAPVYVSALDALMAAKEKGHPDKTVQRMAKPVSL